MLYIALITFVFLVGWMVREQIHETRERDEMNNFYRSEYHRPFLTTN